MVGAAYSVVGALYSATGALYSWAATGVCTTVAGTGRVAGALYSAAEGALGSSKPVAQSTGWAAAATGAGDTAATGAAATGAAATGAAATGAAAAAAAGAAVPAAKAATRGTVPSSRWT